MKAGFAQVDLTPPIGTLLAGYKKYRKSDGVHDPICGKILIIEFQNELFCFIQMDVICVETYFVEIIYEQIKQFGIKRSHLIIGANHTHSGPMGLCNNADGITKGLEAVFGDYDEKLVKNYAVTLVDGVKRAIANKIDAKIAVGTTCVEGVASERHKRNIEENNQLFAIQFIREDGKNIVVYNFSCHPTVLSQENLKITNDLTYGVGVAIGHEYDMIMFFNGASGDRSTRFTREKASFEETRRLGKILGTKIIETLNTPQYEGPLTTLEIKQYKTNLKLKKIRKLQELETIEARLQRKLMDTNNSVLSKEEGLALKAQAEGIYMELSFARAFEGEKQLEIEINIIKLNEWYLVTIPGELFSTLGKLLGDTVVFGYVNGYYLYVVDQEAYGENYYEVCTSIFEKGEGEKLINFIIEKIASDF